MPTKTGLVVHSRTCSYIPLPADYEDAEVQHLVDPVNVPLPVNIHEDLREFLDTAVQHLVDPLDVPLPTDGHEDLREFSEVGVQHTDLDLQIVD